MIVPLEDALLLVYRTRSSGEVLQHQKQVVPFITTATAFGGWVCMPAMREALPGALRQRSLSVPALLGHWLSLQRETP